MKLKPCADNVLNVRSKPQVHVRVPVRSGGPQIVPPVQLASDVQTVPALPAAQVAMLANNVLLICWNRWSYTRQLVSGALGVELGSTCPPATCTHTLIPISAVAVLIVEESFVLVNSPVTADGVINRVTPLPLEVLMVVSSNTHSVPSTVGVHSGLKVPVLEFSVHTVGFISALKLPLLCARAMDAESMAVANTSTDLFMLLGNRAMRCP